jgi:Peptidase C39 family
MTTLIDQLILLTVCTSAPVDANSGQPVQLPSQAYWQVESACGANALYCLLRIHRKPANYLEVLNFLSPPKSGSSLEELRRASAHWGLTLTPYTTNRKGFDRIRKPCIAHVEHQGALHFLLVMSNNGSGIAVWDPETGERIDMKEENFFRMWTGYVLAAGLDDGDRILPLLIALEVITLGSLTLMLLKLHVGRRAPHRSDPGTAVTDR